MRPIVINECAPVTLCAAPPVSLKTNADMEHSITVLEIALAHCAVQVSMIWECQRDLALMNEGEDQQKK